MQKFDYYYDVLRGWESSLESMMIMMMMMMKLMMIIIIIIITI